MVFKIRFQFDFDRMNNFMSKLLAALPFGRDGLFNYESQQYISRLLFGNLLAIFLIEPKSECFCRDSSLIVS